MPEEPQFQGLGKAVVMPPPGYHPTNPNTWRREQPRPARPAPRSAAPAAAATEAPTEDGFRGRRRVAAGPDYRGDGRRGPGRRAPAGGPAGRRGRIQDAPGGRRKKRGGMVPAKQASPTPRPSSARSASTTSSP